MPGACDRSIQQIENIQAQDCTQRLPFGGKSCMRFLDSGERHHIPAHSSLLPFITHFLPPILQMPP